MVKKRKQKFKNMDSIPIDIWEYLGDFIFGMRPFGILNMMRRYRNLLFVNKTFYNAFKRDHFWMLIGYRVLPQRTYQLEIRCLRSAYREYLLNTDPLSYEEKQEVNLLKKYLVNRYIQTLVNRDIGYIEARFRRRKIK